MPDRDTRLSVVGKSPDQVSDPGPETLPVLEHDADALLAAALQAEAVEAYGTTPERDAEALNRRKDAADLLVKLRLMRFTDEGRTQLALTNPGRYWALNGGYMAFLKEEPDRATTVSAGGRGRNPELEQLRYNFMTLRMRTFWWSFGISIASFLLSMLSLYFALRYGGALLGR